MRKMRKLSRSDLETISLRVLRAYWRLDGAKENPWYVDPDMLLTDLLGLKMELYPDGPIISETILSRKCI